MGTETTIGDGAAARPQNPVRAARNEDLPAVLRLLEQLGYEAESPWVAPVWKNLLADPQYKILVAVADDEVLGLITMRVHLVLRLRGPQVSLEELVVRDDQRGRGFGRLLVAAAKRYAASVGAVRLEVLCSQTRESHRRGFYRNTGFTPAASQVYRIDRRPAGRLEPSVSS